jgi:hypothetical protein
VPHAPWRGRRRRLAARHRGPIRFEIDNTALHVWSTVSHAAALQGKERSDFVAVVWPSLKSGLDLLKRWKDPKTGLPWPANEDDHFELTSWPTCRPSRRCVAAELRLGSASATHLAAGSRHAAHFLGPRRAFGLFCSGKWPLSGLSSSP